MILCLKLELLMLKWHKIVFFNFGFRGFFNRIVLTHLKIEEAVFIYKKNTNNIVFCFHFLYKKLAKLILFFKKKKLAAPITLSNIPLQFTT
jgi:hypothetical protein